MVAQKQQTTANQQPSPGRDSMRAALAVLTALADQHNRSLKPETMELLALGLANGLTPDQISRAGSRAVSECRFFPSVAELREFAGAQALKPSDDAASEALAAWNFAVAWVRRHAWRLYSPHNGQYADGEPRVPALAPRVHGAMVACGGADAIYHSTLGNDGLVEIRKKSFCEHYRLDGHIAAAHAALPAAAQCRELRDISAIPLPQLPAMPEGF